MRQTVEMTNTTVASAAKKVSPLAVPLLGLLAAIQGAGPNISSTALIGASRGLHMDAATQALAASTQTLAIAASVITTGLLADRLGRRKVLVSALLLSIVGNLVIMAAANPEMYIAGQVLTGVGLGATYAAAFAYIQVVAKPGKVAGAMGTFAAVCGLFTIVFTFAGGTLASSDWRLAFLVVPVMAAIAILLVLVLLPTIAPLPATKHDVWGQVFLAAGLVSLLYGVSHLADSLTSLSTWMPIIAGLALIALFVITQAKVKHPFFPVALFKNPIFIAAILAGFIYNFGQSVAFLQLTNLWQYILELKTSEVSMWQLPLLFAGIVSAVIFGRLMSRGMSNQAALLSGSVISALGFFVLYISRDGKDFMAFLPGGLLVGAGIIVASLPYGTLILSQAPKEFFGPVTSSRTTFGQLFYSIGLAVSSVFIDQLTLGGVTKKLLAAGVPADQVGTGIDAVNAYASAGTKPTDAIGAQALSAAHDSYVTAYGTLMFGTGVLILVAGFVAYMLIRRGLAAKSAAAPAAA